MSVFEILKAKIKAKLHEPSYQHTGEDYYTGLCDAESIVLDVEQKYNNGWIPCSERLPNANEFLLSDDVLVSLKDSNARMVAFYDYNNKKWCMYGSTPYFGEVTAWQPLPPKYEPNGE